MLTINSVDLTQSGLAINAAARYSGGDSVIEVNYASRAAVTIGTVATTASFTFTYRGPSETFTTASNFQIFYGTQTLTITVNTGESQAITQGRVFALGVATAIGQTQGAAVGTFTTVAIVSTLAGTPTSASSFAFVTQNQTNYISETDTTQINEMISELDSALTTLRTNASTLGSNVALLSTRLDFTNEYVNTLDTGSSKLTLADINEEGANLLALQTRQQLGISALSFAGQAEQSILALFR